LNENIVEYIDVDFSSCLGNRGTEYTFKKYVECINIVGSSRPCKRGIKYFIKDI